MLTARTQETEKLLAFESGADDYVTKPFSVRELRARIAALLRRAGTEYAPSTVRVGDAEIDFGRGEIRRRGESSLLTAIEFKLLKALVSARGRILTREQLVAEGWGPGASLSDRAVDNHIGSLRRKIEADAAEPRYLKNIRGLGYRFDT
jgi:two-component system alkaline phosphatase synthesis response regulator PhoP